MVKLAECFINISVLLFLFWHGKTIWQSIFDTKNKTTASPRKVFRKQQHTHDESYQRIVECFQIEESKRYGSYVQLQGSDMWREISPVNLQNIDDFLYFIIKLPIFCDAKRLIVVEWPGRQTTPDDATSNFDFFFGARYLDQRSDCFGDKCPRQQSVVLASQHPTI